MENKKVALLVETTLISRVVVNVPADWDEKSEENLVDTMDYKILEKVANEAAQKYHNAIDCGIIENIDVVHNDTEMPYDEEDDFDMSVENVTKHLYEKLGKGKYTAHLEGIEYGSENGESFACSISLVDKDKGVVRIGYDVDGYLFTEDRNLSDLIYTDFLDEVLWELNII